MKRPLLILATALVGLTACDKKPSSASDDAQRQADERRLTELRDLEQRQQQRDADTRAAQLDADRQRLAQDQDKLSTERRRLDDEKAAVQNDEQRLAQWRADEQRLARKEAQAREERERLAAERNQEKARTEAREAKQAEAERKIDFFYSALDPLGDWMEVQPYGYVWQPREAQGRGWRPYTDGTWVFTDYGWTWKGNEPFGWATYHYGRWAQVRRVGWVWVPGSEWAPAWVSWRKSPEYLGWAPLPPEAHSGSGFNSGVDSYYDIGPSAYNFVPVASIGEPTYRGVVVEPEKNVTIVNQTVNVTKINYTTVEQKTVIYNGGPDLQQVNAGSQRQVPRLRLEREPEQGRVGSGTSGNAIVGGVLRMLAPGIASAPRSEAAPTRVKERVAAPQIERGWGTSDSGAQAVRAKFKQEAGEAEERARRAPAGREESRNPDRAPMSTPRSEPTRVDRAMEGEQSSKLKPAPTASEPSKPNRTGAPATPVPPPKEKARQPDARPSGEAPPKPDPASANEAPIRRVPSPAGPMSKPPIEPNRLEPRPVEDRAPAPERAEPNRPETPAKTEVPATPPANNPVRSQPPQSAPPAVMKAPVRSPLIETPSAEKPERSNTPAGATPSLRRPRPDRSGPSAPDEAEQAAPKLTRAPRSADPAIPPVAPQGQTVLPHIPGAATAGQAEPPGQTTTPSPLRRPSGSNRRSPESPVAPALERQPDAPQKTGG